MSATDAPARVNSPLSRCERLLELLASRSQAEAPWTNRELAAELCCSERTVERSREWLRDTGRLPIKMAVDPPRTPGNWSLG
jgi:predicted DNA-binding transcriptional regulator YafY